MFCYFQVSSSSFHSLEFQGTPCRPGETWKVHIFYIGCIFLTQAFFYLLYLMEIVSNITSDSTPFSAVTVESSSLETFRIYIEVFWNSSLNLIIRGKGAGTSPSNKQIIYLTCWYLPVFLNTNNETNETQLPPNLSHCVAWTHSTPLKPIWSLLTPLDPSWLNIMTHNPSRPKITSHDHTYNFHLRKETFHRLLGKSMIHDYRFN